MLELGQLERQHAAFTERKTQIFVVSNDDLETAQKTQQYFPHLIVVSDPDQAMAKALQVIHAGAAQDGSDTAAPTTFLFQKGEVRWLFRPGRVTDRLSPEQLLEKLNKL